MNNLTRFNQALDWKPIDRLMTYDFFGQQKNIGNPRRV